VPRTSQSTKRVRSPDGAAKCEGDQRLAKRTGTSLHHQVFLVLRDRILSGQPEVGAMLPSEDELARQFAVSRVTLRVAMANLEAERLIERRQGVGTFVAPHPKPRESASDLIEQITDLSRSTTAQVLEFDYRRAPAHIQAVFGCDPDAVFQRAVRLRLKGSTPIFCATTYVPQEIAKNFSLEQLEKLSLYQLLAQSGILIASGVQVVSAQLADPVTAPLLDVAVGAPLLQLKRQYVNSAGVLIGYVEILASPLRFEVKMSMDDTTLHPRTAGKKSLR
jgi:GntR family transcriptional regulator